MTKLVGNIEKSAISALRSDAVVTSITTAIYDGYTEQDAQEAVSEFLGHLTLSNEDAVKAACGDYFDKIQSAFTAQEQTISTQLAERVIEDDKASVKALVQKYINSLQYKHSIDNGLDAVEAEQPTEAV